MLRKFVMAAVLVTVMLGATAAAFAQQPDITVGEIQMPNLRWGPQKATFTVTNNTDYPKIISVRYSVKFEGTYLNPSRETRTNYFFDPQMSKTIKQDVIIPGNYGTAHVRIEIYDVVDTLDVLLPYQIIAQQPFTITYHVPDDILPYFQEPVTFPPMVENNQDFDTEFSRLILLLMAQGKTPDQIADMAKCDTSFVTFRLSVMQHQGYASKATGQYKLLFPVIMQPEAEAGKALAEQASDRLVTLIKNNFPNYKRVLDSMVQTGILPPNADDFLHGGSVLYYYYPTVSALFLWFDLGTKFINNGRPLEIFEATNYCDAYLPKYMYAVEGGAFFNGTNLYDQWRAAKGIHITYGDSIPAVECVRDFGRIAVKRPETNWNWASPEKEAPEPFVMDSLLVRTGLTGLEPGTKEFLQSTEQQLKEISEKYGHPELMRGEKYWFWNLMTSRTLAKLQEQKIVVDRGSGHFSFEELE